MSENTNNNGNGNGGSTQTGTPGNQGGGNGSNTNTNTNTNVDLSSLNDEQFGKVFEDKRLWEHPRFKELTEAKNKLKDIEQKNKEAEENKLKEQNEWKTLAERKDEEIKNLKTQVQQSVVNNSLLVEFQKAGFIDADAALKLVDRSKIEIKEDGTVSGITEAVELLKTKSPYLVGSNTARVGSSGGNPADGSNGVKRFKHSQLKDPEFYRANEKDIMEAMAKGQIENDL